MLKEGVRALFFRIAIVEDDLKDRESLREYIDRYFAEEGMQYGYAVDAFDDAMRFLASYRAEYDMVFLDIQMPYLNGMDTAEHLRKIDREVPIIFVTNMAQYAVRGYNVNALGFIVKPVSYYDVRLRMAKAINIAVSRKNCSIVLSTKQEMRRLSVDEIYYVEVTGHSLHYHILNETMTVTGSINDAEEQLSSGDFVRCHNSFLVNLQAIRGIKGYVITLINGETIAISRPRKKEFMIKLNKWLGEGMNT